MKTVLVVDDDDGLRKQIHWAFKDCYRLTQAANRTQMHDVLQENSIDLVLLDLHLPPRQSTPEEGIKALKEIKSVNPGIKVIVITGDNEEETSLRAIDNGACDYFRKPLILEEMKVILDRTLYVQSLVQKNQQHLEKLVKKHSFAQMVGKSKKMTQLFEMIERIAPTDCTVLVQGESGTGKELVSRAIHYNSARRDKPFIVVNCAALPETLLEAELFGHEKGAFTDAGYKKDGMFEVADKGTIFLDEISDMSPRMQAKILRVIQERCFNHLGSTKPIQVDVRILAATNKDLEKMIEQGTFREDLYYRLNVVSILAPLLRERKEDIPLLAQHFLTRYANLRGKKIKSISPQVMDQLCRYSWPGNVRELENVMERAVILSKENVILPEHLPVRLRQSGRNNSSFSPTCHKSEKEIIMQALQLADGNQCRAAKKLGIHRNTLRRKIQRLGITRS